NRTVKYPFGRRHCHKGKDFSTPARLTKNGYVARVPPESFDVVANPLQNSYQVEHANVGGAGIFFSSQVSKVYIAIHVEPMIVIHDHCIVIAGEALAVIGEKIMPAAGGKSSAVHVDHDRA